MGRGFSTILLFKRVTENESLCGGLEYRLQCVSMRADMPLKEFMVLPVEVQFITGTGRIDAAGLTERFTIATPFGRYSIEALDDLLERQ